MACLNSCNLGYDVGSIGGAAVVARDDLGWTDNQMEMFVSSANFVAVMGAILGPTVCDGVGRRATFTTSCFVFITGVSLVATSSSFPVMMAGRVLTGLGIGLGIAIDPLYISEISPPGARGRLVSFAELSLNLGILLGMVVDFVLYSALPTGANWRMMIGGGLVMPSILLALTITRCMPESPRWLIMKGREAEANRVLRRTYPPGEDINAVVGAIRDQVNAATADAAEGWKPILRPSPAVKRMLIAGVGLAACQQLNGSEALVYYSPALLEMAGFKSRVANFGFMVLIGSSKALSIFVGAVYVDSMGRRPLLLASTIGMAFCLVVIAAAFPSKALLPVTLTAMCVFLAFFSIGVGPVTWATATEIFPTTIRAKALCMATATNRLVAAVVSATTISLTKAFTVSGFFAMYAVLCSISCVFIDRYIPETKGRSLEEVSALFDAPDPVLAAGNGTSCFHRRRHAAHRRALRRARIGAGNDSDANELVPS